MQDEITVTLCLRVPVSVKVRWREFPKSLKMIYRDIFCGLVMNDELQSQLIKALEEVTTIRQAKIRYTPKIIVSYDFTEKESL